MKRIVDIHEITAENLGKLGGVLRCRACKTRRPLGDISLKLRKGWPLCCGQTMEWVTQKKLDEEQQEAARQKAELEQESSMGPRNTYAWCPLCSDAMQQCQKTLRPYDTYTYYCFSCGKYFKFREETDLESKYRRGEPLAQKENKNEVQQKTD